MFKEPTTLMRWTQRALKVSIAVSAIAVFSGLMEYRLLDDLQNGLFASEDEFLEFATANDLRQGIVGGLQLLAFVVTGVLVLCSIHRANYNAKQLGARGMQFTPAWAIGWYFVPVLSLWKPYQAMKEIWKASVNPTHWSKQPIPTLLGWWWFLWIVSTLLGNLAFRYGLRAEELKELQRATLLGMVSDAVHLTLCVVVMVILTRVYDMQISRYRMTRTEIAAPQEAWR